MQACCVPLAVAAPAHSSCDRLDDEARRRGINETGGSRRAGTLEARKILRAQVHKARRKLERKQPTAEDIHAARKDIKKARATLKLLREAISVVRRQ